MEPVGPISVQIDFKPGSCSNKMNLDKRGVTPVAVLTTEGFDAMTVDPATVELAGAPVVARSKTAGLVTAPEDVDGDGDIDLILHVDTQMLQLDGMSTEATLTGQTCDGQAVEGSDSVVIIQRLSLP